MMDSNSVYILECSDVCKQYATKVVLDNINLSVPQGSIYGLLGPNGAGKTTLIRIINRITAPDKGTVRFCGREQQALDVDAIGYLPEERGLYKKMKVGEQVVYLAQLKGLSKNDALKKIKYWFEKFEITSWWDKKVEELSKGMQQKIQFISTILHEPQLLILDEPFSGFDPINAELLKNEILNLKAEGKTIILSTHNMESVEAMCDNISLINNAQCILQGKVNDIKHSFRMGDYQLEFVGDTEILKQRLSAAWTIKNEEQVDDIVRLTLHSDIQDGNHILSEALPIGTIKAFKELLPSMNDIFIHTVNNAKAN